MILRRKGNELSGKYYFGKDKANIELNGFIDEKDNIIIKLKENKKTKVEIDWYTPDKKKKNLDITYVDNVVKTINSKDSIHLHGTMKIDIDNYLYRTILADNPNPRVVEK